MDNIINDIPDEPFPENLCFRILTLNFKYIREINYYDRNWDNIQPQKQFEFIKKLKKNYEKEWIFNYIDTDYDDY